MAHSTSLERMQAQAYASSNLASSANYKHDIVSNMSGPEELKRLTKITETAFRDGIQPNEYIRREIRAAIQRGNPFINPQNPFIVLGVDGFDGSIFPVGSFHTQEEAL